MRYAIGLLHLLIMVSLLAGSPISAMAESRSDSLKHAEREIVKGNFAGAEKIYRALLDHNRKDKTALLGLSLSLMKQNRLQQAYSEANRVIELDQGNGRAYALAGMALVRLGEIGEAAPVLRRALQLDDRDPISIAALAELNYFERHGRLAYDLLKRAIRLDPNEPDYYVSLARTCSSLELYSEAADAYERFLETAPKTDVERRECIQGIIDFYRRLGNTTLHLTLGSEIATVPFELKRNRPYISVKINGKGPFRFVVDSGASISIISDSAADKLGVKPAARGGHGRAIGGNGLFPLVYGLLDSLSVGEAVIERVPVQIRTVPSPADTPADEIADGYLGLSVLNNYIVTLDYQSNAMTLDRSLKPEASQQKIEPASAAAARIDELYTPIPMRTTTGGFASVEASLSEVSHPLNFIVDTAASISVISDAAVKRFNLYTLKIPGQHFRVSGAAGGAEEVEALGLKTLEVSGVKRINGRALILDMSAINETAGFEQHGILGGDFLRNFCVQLDLRQFQLRLLPPSKAPTVAGISPE